MLRGGADVPERTATDVAEDMRLGVVQLVDVREVDEWDAGHIDGARLIPLGALGSRLAELDRDQPVVTACRSGKRSLVAAKALTQAGFRDVANLEGGLIAWQAAGQPVVR